MSTTTASRTAADDVLAGDAGPVGPPVRARARRLAAPAALAGVLLLVVLVVAVGSSGPTGYLDPDGASPHGGRALRVLLEQQGVHVTAVSSTDAAVTAATAGTTLFVASSDELTTAQLRRIADVGADVVAADVDGRAVRVLAPGLIVQSSAPRSVRAPACTMRPAERAGNALTGGLTVATAAPSDGTALLCYPDSGGATVARVDAGPDRSVTVVGIGATFTNDELAREGDAALALNLLGSHDRLVWYVATTEVDGSGSGDVGGLLPRWVGLVVLQLVVVVLLAAIWRGRRLGPVVQEPLPVVVRAAEATEGRARLYRRGRARDRAAELLRAATVERLRPLVGAPARMPHQEVVAVVAGRTGREPSEVAALLYGAAPRDDAALVRLADDLDMLERRVRTR